jgi:hypothetical protein
MQKHIHTSQLGPDSTLRSSLRILLVAVALAMAAPALAEEEPVEPEPLVAVPKPLPAIPHDRLVLNDLTIFRLNPQGLETQIRFGWQHKLYDADESLAKRDNFVFGGTFIRLNPASARVAGMFEFQPYSVLNLRFMAEYLHYFGNYTFIQSRPSAYDDLSESAMKANEKGPQGNYAASGFHAAFEPLLQFKVGPLVLRNKMLIGWFDMNLRAGDHVWYESTLDVALPGKGMVFANDLDLLYQVKLGSATLNIGPRYTVVAPFYTAEQVLPTQFVGGVDNGLQRLGLLAAYTFYDDGYTKFNKPTAILLTSWYLKQRYRTGEDMSQAVPYFLLGFAFQSDFLDVK